MVRFAVFGVLLAGLSLAGCGSETTPPAPATELLDDFTLDQPRCVDESRVLCAPALACVRPAPGADAVGRFTFFANPPGSWTLLRWPVRRPGAQWRRIQLRARAPQPTRIWVVAIERGRGPAGWTQLEHFGHVAELGPEWITFDLPLADFEFRWGLEGDRRLDPARLDGIALAPADGSLPSACELGRLELLPGDAPAPATRAGHFSGDLRDLVARLDAAGASLGDAPEAAGGGVLDRVRNATVQVRVSGPWTSRAGGVRLAGGRHILTNKHVVSSPGAIEVVAADASLHRAAFLGGADWDERFVFSGGVDLAVLELAGDPPAVPAPAPAGPITTGTPLISVTPRVRGDQVRHDLRVGRAIQLGRPGLLFATLPAEPGMSGSPVCTADGRLAGVLCGRAGRYAAIVTLERLTELARDLAARRDAIALQPTLGLLLEPQGDQARIAAVVPLSAAWTLGLQAGDEVRTVHGLPAGDLAAVRRQTAAPPVLTLGDGRTLTLEETTK